MHIHGALFFAWTFYFVWQASLVGNGRLALHRASGLAGIAPASAVVCTAIGVIGLAVANISRPERHKRWMLVATVSLMRPPIALWFIYFLAPPAIPPLPPGPLVVTLLPGLISDVLIVAGMIYDWRSRGKPHAVYWLGGAILLFVQIGRIPLGESAAWLA